MLTLAKTLAILAFTGAATAKPVPGDGAAFTLESALVHRAPKHQLEHIVDVKRSFGVEVHPELAEAAKQAAAKRSAHLAARKVTGTAFGKSPDPWDTAFIYPVQIAGKTLHLFMTTSASDLFILSSGISKNRTAGHQVYQINPAHKKPGFNFTVGDDGQPPEAEGDVFVEPVTVGGVTAKTAFDAITSATDDFMSGWSSDGRIGLGVKNYNTVGDFGTENTWFDNARPQLAKPLFAIAHTKGRGVFEFGFINQKKISGPITWVDNKLEDYWPAYGFYADGFSLVDPNAKVRQRKMNVHLNSGTDISFTESDIVKEWYSHIPGAVTEEEQGYTIPCNSKPPGWTVVIGGRKFFTPGCQLISQPVDDDGKICLGGLQNIGGGVDFSLFGTNFFKGKYIIHDYANPKQIRLGFAMQPGSTGC